MDAKSLTALGIDAVEWSRPLDDAMGLYAIDSHEREAMFVAQAAHESSGFKHLVENLNYSAQALLEKFPKYFTAQQCADYARDPERIANRIYANRMGNSDEASGDGWRNRGRGLFQLTGADNLRRCGLSLGIDLLAAPELLEQPFYAALSAGWYWSSNGLNEIADTGNYALITRRIVGGPAFDKQGKPINGHASRLDWLARVRRVMK